MINRTASISEIFSSVQGEGLYCGQRHLFVRFEACNIHCEYCDELGKTGQAFDVEAVVGELKKLEEEKGPHRFVSLTGGEPLVYIHFLKDLLPRLKQENFFTYLETNGILSKVLAQTLPWIDVIAMDVKPASVTKERSFIREHEEFLRTSLIPDGRRETFIKMVCSKEIDLNEFDELCEMIASVRRAIPLVLQPITTSVEGHHDHDLMDLLECLQQRGSKQLNDVRIIPRFHRILNLR